MIHIRKILKCEMKIFLQMNERFKNDQFKKVFFFQKNPVKIPWHHSQDESFNAISFG